MTSIFARLESYWVLVGAYMLSGSHASTRAELFM